MAPRLASPSLRRRYVECVDGICRDRSRWYDWGRWIVLVLIIVAFLTLAYSLSCIARRRRRRGAQPMYGTGWMAPAGKYGGPGGGQEMNNFQQGYPQQGYGGPGYGQQGSYPPPPPAYGQAQPQYTGTTFNPNDGYYGDAAQHQQQQQQHGVQQPPPGPPPGK